MEMRKKERTLAGLFSRYAAVFCVNAVLLFGVVFLILLIMSAFHLLLPANYAERSLTENAEEIRRAGNELEKWIPDGCTYGLYSSEGAWKQGTFSGREQQNAWTHYKNNYFFGENNCYYHFIPLENGDICVVRYSLVMRYASPKLNAFLPAPELLVPILYLVLLVLNVSFLSRSFAKRLKEQLQELRVITDKISENDLEFETQPSNIREINEVMYSLGRMKDALQNSLQRQWDLEKQKHEQLSALAHDIKTPLTVIRGNAELLEERKLSGEDRECAAYILTNVKEIEQYLETMRHVLHGTEQSEAQKVLDCIVLEELFQEAAKQLCMAEKMPVSFAVEAVSGKVSCCEENLLRAWKNLVSNAVEHTDQQQGIEISIRLKQKEDHFYLAASVRDYGTGFSGQELSHAAEVFYSGDASRHGRKHQGLGLAIAKRFMEAQGGFLEYQNHSSGTGAEVSLWVSLIQKTL